MKALILDKPVVYGNHTFTQPIIIKHRGVVLKNCTSKDIKGRRWPSIAVEIAVDGYTLEGHKCINVEHGIVMNARACKVINCTVDGYSGDGIRFFKDGAVIDDCMITNSTSKASFHIDAIQAWSGNQTTNYSHKDRFKALYWLKHCQVTNNKIIDDSKVVQGILCVDGLVDDIVIENNFISLPNSPHSISFRGMHGPIGSKVINNFIDGAQMRIQPVRRVSKARLAELGPVNCEVSGNYDWDMNELEAYTK